MSNSEQDAGGTPPSECDVIVVGGGPAGCTAATILARKGWSVTLLEKDRYPRFHIGESLLPMNLPILQRLGVLDEIARIGVLKVGADFPAPTAAGYNVFRFERALDPTWAHAYQVRRDEFDSVLLENASGSGVKTFQGQRVTSFRTGADSVLAEGRSDAGDPFRCEARYLVDATGRDTLVGNQLRLKRKSRHHQSAALFAHFRGVERRPGNDQGNISIYRFEHGWVWLIPLRDGVTSVGAVCWPEYLKQRQGDQRDFLMRTLLAIPALSQRLVHAEIVGNLHATGNYTYACTRMSGPRWVMAGDSYAFVDPIFSSGVYLAMHGAGICRGASWTALFATRPGNGLCSAATNDRSRAALRHSRGSSTGSRLRRCASSSPNRVTTWQLEQAMISMLAGDVFRDNGVHWRLRVFKLIYFITALGSLKEQALEYLWRRRQTRAVFTGGTTSQDSA